ncbi:MAG: hypothetical protein MK111_13790 [Crocosphaera sp.]|uniref:Uncharacterized protein n=3 Tax=Crocosphaera watsonii TaxID=263511 RepID=T2JPC8_CROWT|nr:MULTISPECIES: hypothetical protein [Crocosphaera]EHJ09887.1 hypothetical protein CWATWH0003_5350 [Crocosphaera watsonii WH 0003]MCH2245692.1 hypothetical protein [Crocosphaera sp.]CCQ54249.1 hypothetical protein CWATWH0005_3429 [Crocosphaera watsonii WH 0005]CCQ66392.1 hypothetical protein CWATWH0402_4049 [Crocosphaera watsonii WH 0402]
MLDTFTKIETNFIYPDGTVLDVFRKQTKEGNYVLTDLGALFFWKNSAIPLSCNPLTQEFLSSLGIQLWGDLFFTKYQENPTAENIDAFCEGLIKIANLMYVSSEDRQHLQNVTDYVYREMSQQ